MEKKNILWIIVIAFLLLISFVIRIDIAAKKRFIQLILHKSQNIIQLIYEQKLINYINYYMTILSKNIFIKLFKVHLRNNICADSSIGVYVHA